MDLNVDKYQIEIDIELKSENITFLNLIEEKYNNYKEKDYQIINFIIEETLKKFKNKKSANINWKKELIDTFNTSNFKNKLTILDEKNMFKDVLNGSERPKLIKYKKSTNESLILKYALLNINKKENSIVLFSLTEEEKTFNKLFKNKFFKFLMKTAYSLESTDIKEIKSKVICFDSSTTRTKVVDLTYPINLSFLSNIDSSKVLKNKNI